MALMKGKGYWVKVLGKPHKGFEDGPNEWSFDFAPDKDSMAAVKQGGFVAKLRDKGDERGKFLTFRRKEFKHGSNPPIANQPIKVVDHKGKPWNEKTLIGNGSTLLVKYNVYEGRKGNKPIVLSIMVWELVPYEGKSNDDFPIREDDETENPVAEFEAQDDDGEGDVA